MRGSSDPSPLVYWFQAGGWIMWLIVLLGTLLLSMGVFFVLVALFSKRTHAWVLAAVLGVGSLGPVSLGLLARNHAQAQVLSAAESLSEESRQELIDIGIAEAQIPLKTGAVASLPLTLMTFALGVIGLRRRAGKNLTAEET